MEEELCLEKGEKKPAVSKTRLMHVRMEGPDGGWAWMVAFAACIISFIMAGLGRMSGILYVAFIETFGVDRKAASTPFSVRSSTRNLLGPIVGILGQKYGVRAVTITGGILATFSAALCFFAPDIIWITILWGVINGIGTALSVTLPQVVIGKYFVKHATTASGLAFSGGCVGSFLFPVLLEQLLLIYGMQGTFLIIGAIIMHTIPAAMILRKPPWLKSAWKDEDIEKSSSRKSSNPKLDDDNGENEKLFDKHAGSHRRESAKKDFPDIEFLKENNELVLQILTTQVLGDTFYSEINRNEPIPSIETYTTDLDHIYGCLQSSSQKWQFYKNLKLSKSKLYRDMLDAERGGKVGGNHKSQSFQLVQRPEYDTSDITKTSSVPDISSQNKKFDQNHALLKLSCIRSAQSDILSAIPQEKKAKASKVLLELQKLYSTFSAVVASPDKERSFLNDSMDDVAFPVEILSDKQKDLHPNTFMGHINTAVRLHRKPLFLLVCLCRAVHFITFVPVMTTVVDFIMDKGLVEADGKYAIAALSLGDLLGRLCFGWITDRGYMTLPKYMLVVMIVQGACTASLTLMDTKITLFIMLAVFGMFQGSLFIRHNVLVSKYMESHEQSIAMGCMNFFAGLLGFSLPAYIGYFRDTIGSYDYIFYINGAIGVFVGLLWTLEPYFRQKSESERTMDSNAPVAV